MASEPLYLLCGQACHLGDEGRVCTQRLHLTCHVDVGLLHALLHTLFILTFHHGYGVAKMADAGIVADALFGGEGEGATPQRSGRHAAASKLSHRSEFPRSPRRVSTRSVERFLAPQWSAWLLAQHVAPHFQPQTALHA